MTKRAHYSKAARGDRLEDVYVLALIHRNAARRTIRVHREDVNLNEGGFRSGGPCKISEASCSLSPKTSAGKRRIDPTAMTVAALREQRKRLLAEGLSGFAVRVSK